MEEKAMKKFLITILSLMILFTFSFGSVETVFAADNNELVVSKNANNVNSLNAEDEVNNKLDATEIKIHSELVKRSNGRPAISVYFDVKSDAEISGIEVFRSVGNTKNFGSKPIITTSKGQYNNTKIRIGKKYYYKVRAYVIDNGVKKYTNYSKYAYRTVKKNPTKKMTSPKKLEVVKITSLEQTEEKVEEIKDTPYYGGGSSYNPPHSHVFKEQSGVWKCACGETVSGTETDLTYIKVSSTNSSVCSLSKNGKYIVGNATVEVNGNDISYKNTGASQTNILKTNGQNITIDAPEDDVVHSGTAGNITIKNVAQNSYHGNADAVSLTANGGHIELNASITNAVIDANYKTTIDVKADGSIGHVDFNSVSDGVVEDDYPTLSVEGAVTSVELNTGKANIDVKPGAKKVPSVHLGAKALEEYENRIKERQETLGTFTDLWVRFGEDGKIEEYEDIAPILNLGEPQKGLNFYQLTEEQASKTNAYKIENGKIVYTKDIYIWGDFARVMFMGCKFEGNVYNMGEEQTLLRFFMCEFDENSNLIFDNSGRNMSVDDLLPKAHFIYCKKAKAVASNCNAAVVNVAGTLEDASVFLNGEEHKAMDAVSYLDERPSATNRTIQKYEGQPIGIHYVGQFMKGMSTDYEIIDLGEPNVDDENSIQTQLALYSYVTISGTDIETSVVSHTNVATQSDNIFDIASFTSCTSFTNAIEITAPYNHVKIVDCDFQNDISIYGIYTDVVFKNCKFASGTNITYYTDYAGGKGAYEGGKVTFDNCTYGNSDITTDNYNTNNSIKVMKLNKIDYWSTKTDFIVISENKE